jgi:hypothetical protein
MSTDEEQIKIIMKIIEKLSDNQKEELLFHISGNDENPVKHSDVEEYKRLISETQAEIQKLTKANRQQLSTI